HTSELQSLTNLVCRLLLEKKTTARSEEHTSELQSLTNLVCRLLLENNALGISEGKPLERDSAQGGTGGGVVRWLGVRHIFFLKIRRPPNSSLFSHHPA